MTHSTGSVPGVVEKLVIVGGEQKKDCEKYGDSGTHIASRPTKEELIEIKKAREKRRKAELRAAKAKNKSL